ncbi:hypothetical protein [Blastococcus sp. SYSU DS0616]
MHELTGDQDALLCYLDVGSPQLGSEKSEVSTDPIHSESSVPIRQLDASPLIRSNESRFHVTGGLFVGQSVYRNAYAWLQLGATDLSNTGESGLTLVLIRGRQEFGLHWIARGIDEV